ncbi:MAG: hypothetical protein IKR26_05025 [Lachnospiraceae bacterium]|nr:hypothetical protein [Lachnospiraceae bacterium]
MDNYETPAVQPNTLVWGILSLALCCFIGWIFGIVGRKKGSNYVKQGGTLTGASKVGYILSLVGIIVSIVSTIILIIYIAVVASSLSTLSSLMSGY